MDPYRDNDRIFSQAATTARLRPLAAVLRLDETRFGRALELAGVPPTPARWTSLTDHFLLALGNLLILAGIAAFFAYNWADLHRFAKLGLVETGIILCTVLAWYRGLDSPAGRGALFGAAFLVGVLLAVFGQAYQTGADPYGLFAGWALLILGWGFIGRQAGIWMLLVVLLNMTLILYWEQVLFPPEGFVDDFTRALGPLFWLAEALGDFRLALLLFGFNGLVLVIWERLAARGPAWMQGRWFPRLVAVFALGAIVLATLLLILLSLREATDALQFVSPVLFATFALICLWYYRERYHDLFILSICLLGIILVVTATIARLGPGGFEMGLILALLVIGQTAWAAFWLRQVSRRWRTQA